MSVSCSRPSFLSISCLVLLPGSNTRCQLGLEGVQSYALSAPAGLHDGALSLSVCLPGQLSGSTISVV